MAEKFFKIHVASNASVAANSVETVDVPINPCYDAVITMLRGQDAATNLYDLLANIRTQDNLDLLTENIPFGLLFPRHGSQPNYLEPAIRIPGGTSLKVVFQNTTGAAITNVFAVLYGYLERR